jgi:hypothetical protein
MCYYSHCLVRDLSKHNEKASLILMYGDVQTNTVEPPKKWWLDKRADGLQQPNAHHRPIIVNATDAGHALQTSSDIKCFVKEPRMPRPPKSSTTTVGATPKVSGRFTKAVSDER